MIELLAPSNQRDTASPLLHACSSGATCGIAFVSAIERAWDALDDDGRTAWAGFWLCLIGLPTQKQHI